MTDAKEDILTAAEERNYIKQLAIVRTKIRSSLLKPKEALTNLKDLATQQRTSTAVLVGIIIVAENITVSQKPEDNTQNNQPVTNPELVPDAAQVIENAVKNPKSDEVVADAADSAVSSIKDNAAPSQQEEINKRLENIEKLLRDILKRMEQQQSNQTERPQQKPQWMDGLSTAYGMRDPDPQLMMKYGIHTKPNFGVMPDGTVVTKDKGNEWKDFKLPELPKRTNNKDLDLAMINHGKIGKSNG